MRRWLATTCGSEWCCAVGVAVEPTRFLGVICNPHPTAKAPRATAAGSEDFAFSRPCPSYIPGEYVTAILDGPSGETEC